jgi:GNAT superfamily N-acetyltransferase/DNA-binding MarR family transcriptional regulator
MEIDMNDALRDFGPVFLGSRLKRLGEKMQIGAAQIIAEAGLPVQPTHMPLLTALHRNPMTIGQLVEAVGSSQPGITRGIRQLTELGFVCGQQSSDLRQNLVSLTPAGISAMACAKLKVWPLIEHALGEMLSELKGSFLDQITQIETALIAQSLYDRAISIKPNELTIREYSEELAHYFHDINAEWITSMFRLEQTDREVLENPGLKIMAPGGDILFVEAEGLGIIGTCALQKTDVRSFELTKMGVRESARGLKAGAFLLNAMIERAHTLGAEHLYLLTNARCEAAIHLYERHGFRHDRDIMENYGKRYERCDVAMRYFG